jgi:hypothetical protein
LILPAGARTEVVGVHAVLAKVEAFEFPCFAHADSHRQLKGGEDSERRGKGERAVVDHSRHVRFCPIIAMLAQQHQNAQERSCSVWLHFGDCDAKRVC